MNTTPRRVLVIVVAIVTGLITAAAPAGATTHAADITGGIVAFDKVGVYEEFSFVTGCAATYPSTLDLDVTGTSVSVTALAARSVETFGITALVVFSRSPVGNTAGTLTGTTISSMRVTLLMDFYASWDANCTPTVASSCKLAVVLNLGGTLSGTTASSTFSLSGTSVGTVAAWPTCSAGPSFLAGTDATIFPPGTPPPLAGHLTT